MNTDVPKADNKNNTSTIEEHTKVDEIKSSKEESCNDVVTDPTKAVAYQKIPEKPVMTQEVAAYPKLKKIKAELDNQNSLIFQAEKQRGSLEIALSDLKGFAKITKKRSYRERLMKRPITSTD